MVKSRGQNNFAIKFSTAKTAFDAAHKNEKIAKCIVPVNGKLKDTQTMFERGPFISSEDRQRS